MFYMCIGLLWTWVPMILLVCMLVVIAVVKVVPWWVQSRCGSLYHLKLPAQDGKVPVTVAFFHPYCNAGGGGERVLWVAIRALQRQYGHIRCVIYTGDRDATSEDILKKARDRFNIKLTQPVEFVFLHRRRWVEANMYPVFTLLGQSLGSLVLGWEALLKFVPDIYIDTMGYAFTLPLFRYIGGCKVAAYVHYPTISTDMMQRVSQRTSTHNNERFISRSAILSDFKLIYYRLFAVLYGLVGGCSQVVMVNSSWTEGHIRSLWKVTERTHILYPPCDTKEFTALPLWLDGNITHHTIASIAQFRPEKDHPLQIKAFHEFLSEVDPVERQNYSLVLVGSCRDQGDASRVCDLEALVRSLHIEDQVQFKLNVPFAELKQILCEATIGMHTMWNEHFGIGVVEIMAAGTVILAHDSGGPKMDIVVDLAGQKTGFLAHDIHTYAQAMLQIFSLNPQERLDIRKAARKSVERFSESNFEQGFLDITKGLFT